MKKMNVAYLRVSTEAQTEKYGLDMQKQKIMDYCERNKVVIDKWYVDGGYSGSKLDRPQIQELLNDAENGLIARVFIYKLDRVSRDVIDTLTLLYRVLNKYGIEVISMTEDLKFDNPMDKVVIGVNALVGQYERETIRMRMSAGMLERVKRGYWMGGGRIPYGYYYDRNDGILHPKEDEAQNVREAYKMYIQGYSCDRISKILGFKGERIVIQILKRKSNLGYIEFKGNTYKGLHEPIVDEKTFYEAQECMEKRHTNTYVANDHILSGLCYCGVCGARMRYQKWGKYHKIICYSQQKSKEYMVKNPNCDNIKAFADKVESEVEDSFKNFIIRVDKAQKAYSNVDSIEASIKKTNAKIKKFYTLYAENESDNLLELIKEEEEKVIELKKQLDYEKKAHNNSKAEKLNQIKRVSDVWNELTDIQKNKILKDCVEKIVITGNDIEIRFVTF